MRLRRQNILCHRAYEMHVVDDGGAAQFIERGHYDKLFPVLQLALDPHWLYIDCIHVVLQLHVRLVVAYDDVILLRNDAPVPVCEAVVSYAHGFSDRDPAHDALYLTVVVAFYNDNITEL